MDTIGWLIATMHQMLGHDKAAAFLGQAPYNRATCILCLYESGKATKAEVIAQIGAST
jgi:hypothetical protein